MKNLVILLLAVLLSSISVFSQPVVTKESRAATNAERSYPSHAELKANIATLKKWYDRFSGSATQCMESYYWIKEASEAHQANEREKFHKRLQVLIIQCPRSEAALKEMKPAFETIHRVGNNLESLPNSGWSPKQIAELSEWFAEAGERFAKLREKYKGYPSGDEVLALLIQVKP